MKNERLLEDIRDTNVSYILLAQDLIRENRAEALHHLGIDDTMATLIQNLTPAQMMRAASANMLMCSFRFDDNLVWSLLTSHASGKGMQDSRLGNTLAA